MITQAPPWRERPACRITLPSGEALDMEQEPLVMGVVNVTPDSFSDGGRFYNSEDAIAQGLRLVSEGADILDIGGESTRPGSDAVSADEEKRRVLPVIEGLAAGAQVPLSIDTQKADVAREALDAGASIINDVSALRGDREMAPLAAERGVPVCLMHMQGTPKTMQRDPTYEDVVNDIIGWLRSRIEFAVEAGIAEEKIIVDPGFGFGKKLEHNLELLRRVGELHSLGRPLLVGTSRKSMIGAVLNAEADGWLNGTLATIACAVMTGCHIVRVHDVAPAKEVIKVCEAVRQGICYRK